MTIPFEKALTVSNSIPASLAKFGFDKKLNLKIMSRPFSRECLSQFCIGYLVKKPNFPAKYQSHLNIYSLKLTTYHHITDHEG